MALSSSIHFWKFSLAFTLYCLVSIIIYGMAGNTIIAFILYAFSVAPAYVLGLLYFFVLTVQRKQIRFVRYRKPISYFMIAFQLLTILSSPAICQSKDGEICYSFLQHTLMDVSSHPNHWLIVHLFPWVMLTYTLFTVAFLYTLRVEAATD